LDKCRGLCYIPFADTLMCSWLLSVANYTETFKHYQLVLKQFLCTFCGFRDNSDSSC